MQMGSSQGLGNAIGVEQGLFRGKSPGSIADFGVDQALHRADFPLVRHLVVEALGNLGMDVDVLHRTTKDTKDVLEFSSRLGEERKDELNDLLDILLLRVDHRVRASIVGIGSLVTLALLDAQPVVLDDHADDGTADVVHVEDRGFGVEADGVEGVAVCHRDPREGVKVPVLDRCRDCRHASGDDLLDTMLEESGGLDGALHATG